MEHKGIAPSSKMFGVASSNAGLHFQMESTVSTMCPPYQGITHSLCIIFLCSLTSVPPHLFPDPAFPVSSALLCHVFRFPSFVRHTPSATWGLCPCLCLPLSVCLCQSASKPTILSESMDLLGLHANSHWTALSTTHHRHRNNHLIEIEVSREYASRPK